MGDDAYKAWKSTTDHSDSSNPADGITAFQSPPGHYLVQEGVTSPTLTQLSLKPSSPPPRSSSDSPARSPASKHRTTKELASRYERVLQDAEINMEKSKARLDVSSEELERVLLQKEGESFSESAVQVKPGILRQEDDIRLRVSNASDSYRKALNDTQAMRQEYFNFQLPRILRALKDDGSTLVPIVRRKKQLVSRLYTKQSTTVRISRRICKTMHMHMVELPRTETREGPAEEGFLPPLPTHNASYGAAQPPQSVANGNTQISDRGRPTFGIDLAEQMARDQVELPPILEKCCVAIEKYGIRCQGIYRLSGMARRVGMLKERLDKGNVIPFNVDRHTIS
ncbi:hypothetical protein EDD16DRAFT_1711835 [Pisolithus croceorrhizus]|nr:hypothetical protein EDD16DRAFT_1711835 [Pisolithus croceorrhizus]